MRIRRIVLRAALVAALASAGIGAAAGVAQASPLTNCANWAAEAAYYGNLGQSYTTVGNALTDAGLYSAAQDAYDNASIAFAFSATYTSDFNRNCHVP